jgi:hypothetical protein
MMTPDQNFKQRQAFFLVGLTGWAPLLPDAG